MLNEIKVKKAPRRWQDEKKRNYDLILAYDIRAYNILIEEFESSRGQLGCHPVHIIGSDHTTLITFVLSKSSFS